MRALVTGSNGFIGSFLVEALLYKEYAVRCLVRETSDLTWIKNFDVELVYGSLSDPQSLTDAVKDVQIVFHLAGRTRGLRREDYYRDNTEGTKRLLDACLAAKSSPPKVVFTSSQAAAGPSNSKRPKTEDEEPKPVSIYGKSKLAAEELVNSYAKSAPAVIVRPPSVYGPRDVVLLRFFQWLNRGFCPMLGFKKRALSLVHIHDLVAGLVLAAERSEANGKTYFMCNDNSVLWDEVGAIAAEVLGKRILHVRVPVFMLTIATFFTEIASKITGKLALINLDKVREMRQKCWICDNSRAKKELGFAQQVSLQEGINDTLNWYKEMAWLK